MNAIIPSARSLEIAAATNMHEVDRRFSCERQVYFSDFSAAEISTLSKK